jgi:peptide/nickel transport system substrate-binding protein
MALERRARRGWRRTAQLVGVVAALALVASACGDDDDDSGAATETSAAAATTAGSTSATTAGGGGAATTAGGSSTTSAGQPVVGGEATVLLFSEIGTVDPVSSTGSGGSDAQRMFPIYGALVTYVSEDNDVRPYFAQSMTPNADFTVWTIKLNPGITFSDGAPYDAEAIKTNWTRVQDPAKRSPAFGAAAAFESMTVVDPTTLEVKLKTPNAHLPNSISRFGALNYLASPKAIAAGQDLTSAPVGAGPFLMQEWIRDDHMTLVRNPNFFEKPKPYLDKITLRVVGDEQQRLDTFLKGDADAGYTSIPGTVTAAKAEGAEYAGVSVGTGQTYVFNTSKPPFSDPRVRQAFVLGVDREALSEIVFGPGSKAATNFSREGTPWFDAAAIVPAYDKAKAQELFTAAAADLGGTVKIQLQGFQQSLDQKRAEFIQTQLNSYEGVEVEITINDSPTSIGNVLRGEYEVSSWGFPYLDPEPGVYNALRTGLPTNYSKYTNPAVDQALDQARVTDDDAARLALYKVAWEAASKDLPYYPYVDTTNGFVVSEDLHGAEVYEDGILRFDLLWKTAG